MSWWFSYGWEDSTTITGGLASTALEKCLPHSSGFFNDTKTKEIPARICVKDGTDKSLASSEVTKEINRFLKASKIQLEEFRPMTFELARNSAAASFRRSNKYCGFRFAISLNGNSSHSENKENTVLLTWSSVRSSCKSTTEKIKKQNSTRHTDSLQLSNTGTLEFDTWILPHDRRFFYELQDQSGKFHFHLKGEPAQVNKGSLRVDEF